MRSESDARRPTLHDETHMSDEQLLQAFLRGDGAMFHRLVRRHEVPLHAFICRVSGAGTDAADLFQETFLRVYQHAGTFRGRSSFKTWLYSIALNICRSYGRSAARRRPVSDLAGVDPPADGPGPNGEAESTEIGRSIERALGELPAAQREVFVMKAYEQMTYGEIADVVGLPLGTLKSQMRLALKKLRTALHSLAQAHGLA